ncbi:hypothetical protein [Pseudovibrio sp. Tun.PSC04-5.I4]|uniref:hypothetical protein n=1 Tax=Pseudovibrio sp. Tun.PSC04-5.I4 TaxID=1798213 RepID=UPI000882933D|nr:hypothetical protein [Pseudovibrio sp. Tun.PSC04-5.I4]SDQ73006.1 hypothetical protein SAMN04515695_1153 [Pseudovibrio sp. Tun.PSC04-5.I4]
MFLQFSPQARRAFVFGVAGITIYLFMVLGTLANLEALSGLKPFDMRPAGYGPEDAHALLASLGEAGRKYYLERQLLLDALYPALLALTLSNFFYLTGNGLNVGKLVRAGVIISWLAASLDYVENACIAAMLKLWPEIPNALVNVASLATISKSISTSLAVTGLVGLIIWRMWCKRKMSLAAQPFDTGADIKP